jgi:hypothetical protein
MEKFIITIQSLQKEINDQKIHPAVLINNIVIQKQYLVYYLYRTICHYFDFFRSIALVNSIKDINENLEISSKHQYICYPLANRMTTNENKLDTILSKLIELLTIAVKKIKELKRTNEPIETYLATKTQDVIISDIKELIKFVPNLSKYQYY